jgi:hypothetical protein
MKVDSLLRRAARHLQLALSPLEYAALYMAVRKQYHLPPTRLPYDDEAPHFWEQIPKYLIARCPLCGGAYTERLDTYSLDGWVTGGTDDVFSGGEQQHHCGHFAAVQTFIHLNDVVPTGYFSGGSEVPYVMPIFLPDDPVSYAVIHSLPICRVEAGVFVPRYLLFMVTYFSQNPQALYDRRWQDWEPGIDRLPLMYTWMKARGIEEAWDLPKWVAEGKLYWLDLDRDNLPLRSGPVEKFPYGNIEGLRREFIYRDGKLTIPFEREIPLP